jgi:Cu/Ag efflux pump CusA
MRERAVTTSIIWIALAVCINQIFTNLTSMNSEILQIGSMVLAFVLILAALGGTIAIWESAAGKKEEEARKEAEKAKRDNREARVKRLLATLDDDELEALESVDEEGEHLSLEALLRKRN